MRLLALLRREQAGLAEPRPCPSTIQVRCNVAKRNRKRTVVAVASLILACFVVPFPFLSDVGVADVREAAIRWLLRHNHSGLQDGLKACFVGIGTTFDPHDRACMPHDPPPGFVARFSDFPVPVFPVSTSTNVPDGIGGRVTDAEGKSGLTFAAGNVKRWSVGVVVCRGLYYEGGLSAAGYDIFILRLPFVWVPVRARVLWAS
jgi:hypothetical protein